MNREVLARYGIDYQNGIARCMDNAELYETLLALFLQDDTLIRAKAALESRDYTQLFKYMHELKGACGSADMTELYQAVCPLVELLRNNEPQAVEVDILFTRVEAAYNRAQEGISLASRG